MHAHDHEQADRARAAARDHAHDHTYSPARPAPARDRSGRRSRPSEYGPSSAQLRALQGIGYPLPAAVRPEMEAHLGADLTDVRLHTDRAAQQSAEEIDAAAYTSGNHIVLGSQGTDKHTLIHELAHVLQQRSGPVAGTDDGTGLHISDPGDPFERAAEATADSVMSGGSVPRHGMPVAIPAASPGVGDAGATFVQQKPKKNKENKEPEEKPYPPLAPAFGEFHRRERRFGEDYDGDYENDGDDVHDSDFEEARDYVNPVSRRMLDRIARALTRAISTPHLATILLPNKQIGVAGNSGGKKVNRTKQRHAIETFINYINAHPDDLKGKLSNRDEQDRIKIRHLFSGGYGRPHPDDPLLADIANSLHLDNIFAWTQVIEGSQGSQHGELTLLSDEVGRWRKHGEPRRTVHIGGVKMACRACQWAFDATNEYIGIDLRYEVQASGTHNVLFPFWLMPKFLEDNAGAKADLERQAKAAGAWFDTTDNGRQQLRTPNDAIIGEDVDGNAFKGDIKEKKRRRMNPYDSESEYDEYFSSED